MLLGRKGAGGALAGLRAPACGRRGTMVGSVGQPSLQFDPMGRGRTLQFEVLLHSHEATTAIPGSTPAADGAMYRATERDVGPSGEEGSGRCGDGWGRPGVEAGVEPC